MEYIGIIPARYASTRFPGKPLADLCGKPVIQHVFERASRALDAVVVATDDERIRQAVLDFGGRAVMTSPAHHSGTDRCWEAYCNCGSKADVIINIQGDEPFVSPEQIEALKQCFAADATTSIATLGKPFSVSDGLEALLNPNNVKLAFSAVTGNALCFSRSVIPFLRGVPQERWLEEGRFFRHVGMYAYRADVLQRLTALPQSPLELAESLEQLRWMENGYAVRVALTDTQSVGIDTQEDLRQAALLMRR